MLSSGGIRAPGPRVLVACVALAGAIGCLSSNDSPPGVLPSFDAGLADTSAPPFDASGAAPGPDASTPDDGGEDAAADAASPVVDAGPPDSGPPTGTQVGLVGGGIVSRSAHYVLVGSTGPATSPVLQSAKYRLTGGMAASSQQ